MIIPIVLGIVLLAIDIISKYAVCAVTMQGDTMTVIRGVLSFTYSENTGASFGMFGEHPVLLTVMTTVFVVALVIWTAVYYRSSHTLLRYALCLMASGAIGNLYDRIVFGYVRDFIDYDFISAIIGRPFAICNFADLVLIIATVLLMVYVLFFYSEHYDSTHPQTETAEQSAEQQTVAEDAQTAKVTDTATDKVTVTAEVVTEQNATPDSVQTADSTAEGDKPRG